jgi:hypothetical protein
MSPEIDAQPVAEAEFVDERRRADRPSWRRRAIAGPAGLALLLAGGALLVRVAIYAVQTQGAMAHTSLFTASVCVLSGVALILVTLPKIVPAERGDSKPTPVSDG